MLEIDATWTSTGSTGGLSPVEVFFPPIHSVMTCAHSTLATSNSISFQTAQAISGPWFTEASTSLSTGTEAAVVMRVTGPYRYVRPALHTASTGTYTIRLTGVS